VSRAARPALPALLVLLVVLAGCGGLTGTPTDTAPSPTAPPTPSPTPTASPTPTPPPTPTEVEVDAPTLNVSGGDLPVDPGRVFAITQRVLGTNLTTYPDVVIQRPEEVPFFAERAPAFYRLLGLTFDRQGVETAAYVRGPETVYVNDRILNRTVLVEYTLVHEYTHVVQHRIDVYRDLRVVGASTDAKSVRTAVIEGAAVYAADTYWQRHIQQDQRPADDIAQVYDDANGATWYVAAQYHLGYRYVDASIDSPADLPRVYDDPPRTSEELVHRLPPGSEPPADLPVNVSGETREWFEVPSRTRMGELFVRAVLRTELSETAAARGADGWGNDALITFSGESGAKRGYVWVLRWDDAANATEFEDAFRGYLDARATREGDLWRNNSTAYGLERIGDRTAVAYVGKPDFVTNATAKVTDGGTVAVRPPS